MQLQDKVAIITGAGDLEGIGAAIAQRYAKEGAKLVIADIQDGEAVVNTIKAQGGEAIFVKTDVTSQESCSALAKACIENFGRIDILVNNAAMFKNIKGQAFTEVTSEEWNAVMNVNSAGPFNCIKAVSPMMLEQQGGKIINLSSSTIYEGSPFMPHYVASKGAVMALTRSMARSLGGGNITINTLAPGFTQTAAGKEIEARSGLPVAEMLKPMRCLQKTPTPEDLAGPAVFLASDDSNFMTGQLLLCDGGINFN
ncbi:3-oxoacyl-ACP reductase FabG [Maricurvus nonylphenolicus]|uniref:SDR family NAD(P)-dependent oxidoreductase n=1 Tax=Maricurvus nonylphenolicus TaxID=1008307 RepID=UPI0036F30A4F